MMEGSARAYSTSAGRKYWGSTLTMTFPVFTSTPCSLTPLPLHLRQHNQREGKVAVRDDLLDLYSELGEGSLHEFADRVGFAGCQYEVLGRRLLKHEPHALNVVLSCTEKSDDNHL